MNIKIGLLLFTFLILPSVTNATIGRGNVVDLGMANRNGINYIIVRISESGVQPACVNWHHHYGKVFDNKPETRALYATLMTAYISKKTVRIAGTNSCLTSTIGSEEISEINIGTW